MDDRAHRVRPELELGDDAEVAATPAQCPEQVGVLPGGRAQHLAVRGDDLGGEQVVADQPVLAGEPAEAAAEGETADAGVADRAARHRQHIRLRVAASSCAQVVPPPHRAVRPSGSTVTCDDRYTGCPAAVSRTRLAGPACRP